MADDLLNFDRDRFNKVDAKLDRVLEALENATLRLGSLEEQVSLRRRESNLLREDFIRLEHRIDGIDRRLAKIEKRLDLVEA
jgi:septal ring factor EnvC (AmiA/AmiB activator)